MVPIARASVVSVSADARHSFSKTRVDSITLVADFGVVGDAHAGVTVQHRSRVRRDPSQPNLRQVHLVPAELHDELNALGFRVEPGDIGENITTRGLDLLALPTGAVLHVGADATIRVTGLRNPCTQLDAFRPGLMRATLDRADDGSLVRKAGVMGVVLSGGVVRIDDSIRVELPIHPHTPLQPV